MKDEFKRKIDYEVLTRIEEKVDDFALAINTLQMEVKSVKDSLFKNNGKECMETRLKRTEDIVNSAVTTKQAIIWLVSAFVATCTFCFTVLLFLQSMHIIRQIKG